MAFSAVSGSVDRQSWPLQRNPEGRRITRPSGTWFNRGTWEVSFESRGIDPRGTNPGDTAYSTVHTPYPTAAPCAVSCQGVIHYWLT